RIVSFKIEKPVRKHPEPQESFTNVFSHCAEVFCYNHRLVSHAFKRNYSEKIFFGTGHIGALFSRHASRYPEKPEQSECMVNSQCAVIFHVLCYELDEKIITGFFKFSGNYRRESPVLSVRVEIIGRCSYIDVIRGNALAVPRIGATAY